MFDDPLGVISCDLPLGWVATHDSGMFRLALEHMQRPGERIDLCVHPSISSRIEDEEVWVAAARTEWDFPHDAARVDLGGATGVHASWREASTWRTRIARRGAGLDLILDHSGDAADERTQRDLASLVAGAVLPVVDQTAGAEGIEEVVAAVDAAATPDDFQRALQHATTVLTARWQSSLARDLGAPDFPALRELVKVHFRYAVAAADVRLLLRTQGLLLRTSPRGRESPANQSLHQTIERQAYEELGGAMAGVPQIFAIIRKRHNQPEDPRLPEMPEAGLRLMLAGYLLRDIRKQLVANKDAFDPHAIVMCGREIFDAALFTYIDLRNVEAVALDVQMAMGEPLVFLIDVANEADRLQEVAEAATLLSDLAAGILKLPSIDEKTTSAATRFLLIGTTAQAQTLVAAADESSLNDALQLVDRALAITSQSQFAAPPDVLNARHLEALATLQLGDLERARAAAGIGRGVAVAAGDQYHVRFFSWVDDVAGALEGKERNVRSIPDFQLALQEKRNDSVDAQVDAACRSVAESIEQNPISLTMLERLVIAAKVVEPAHEELEAAGTALLDLRRLLLDRSPELRIGADDSLLARQLAAGTIEEVLADAGAEGGALAVDHACSRSLVLDLARQPQAVSKIRAAVRHPDSAAVLIERLLRTRAPSGFRLPPPWMPPLRAPGWLRGRAGQLRQWCANLVGVAGGAPLTRSEMLECVERHGEPILMLYPVAGKIGGFLLRPGETPEFRSTTASVEQIFQSVERLRNALTVWKNVRGQRQSDPPSPGVVQDHRGAAAALSELLLDPLTSELPDEGRLTIVPYRELAGVPFGLLPDRYQQAFCESHVLTIVSSISTLRMLQLRPSAGRSRAAFVLGDPDTRDVMVERLPDADEEARTLAARLREATPPWAVQYVRDEDATPAAYRSLAVNADLVHLACHGSVGNVARDSALLLAASDSSTGDLKASDIEAVPLRSAIVFLSACRSGAGRPTADGTIGLSRAFLTAGAKAVVASLWNVPDLSTRLLVESFYDAYLSGADVASSLQQAAIATRQALADMWGYATPQEVHPLEWGSFFVLGQGTTSGDG